MANRRCNKHCFQCIYLLKGMCFGLLFIFGCQNTFFLEYFRLWNSKVKTSIFFLNLLILADVLSANTHVMQQTICNQLA